MKKLIIVTATIFLLVACSKKDTTTVPNNNNNNNNNIPVGKISPDGFDYQTTKQITVNITLQNNVGGALAHIPVTLYGISNFDTTLRVAIAVTDDAGNIHYKTTVPATIDTFVVKPNCFSVLNNAKVYLVNKTISCLLGGSTGYSGNVVGTFHKKH